MLARALLCLVLLNLFGSPASSQEIRAFWADGFAEGFKSPEQVDTLIRRLQTANCNAIFAQMRKGGDANYLSRYEPWANDNAQRFDALAYLIEKAHASKPRIQVHAWINTYAVGKTHGNPHHIVLAHPDWKSFSDTGEDFDGEATKTDPGHPDAADWTFRVYLDVVRNYDVDGIHFDFVRYGSTDGKGRWGYNPVSVARFNARHGRSGQPDWQDPLWKQWRRDQVTALVRKVYAMTQAVNPNVTVSAATITWQDGPHNSRGMSARQFWREKTAGMNRVFQDWRSWMEEGILDINCQMSYFREARHADYFRNWIEWGKQNQYRRWVVPSSGIWLNPIPDSLRQIEAIREPGRRGKRAAGVLLYSYAGTNSGPEGKEEQSEEFFAALAKPSNYSASPPFEKPAEFPKIPWKENPKQGHLQGFVLTSDGLAPVDGARVTLKGRVRRTQYTDGTGFYAFVDLPPGSYTIRVEAPGYARTEKRAAVEKRWATTVTHFVGSRQPGYTEVLPAGDSATAEGTPIWTPMAEVIVGTDTSAGSILVRTGPEEQPAVTRVILRAQPLLPFQPGDVVAVSGAVRRLDGETVVDANAVRLVGMRRVERREDGTGPAQKGETFGDDLARFAGRHVRLAGRIAGFQNGRPMLDASGQRVELLLSGRKLPGVETPVSLIPAPEPGSRVEVEGVLTLFRNESGSGLRISPLSIHSLRVVPPTLADRMQPLLIWGGLPLTVAILPYWIWRKRRYA